MLTEFEVRRRIQAIRASQYAPMRKARMLLRLGRCLSAQVQSLSHAKAQLARTTDRNASAGLQRMATQAELLHEDVRAQAVRVLKSEKRTPFFSN